MTSPLQTTMFNGVSEFYNGVATRSLRFDYDSAPTLYKTPSASSLTTWSWSAWFKLASTANTQFNIFSADSSLIALTIYQVRLSGSTDLTPVSSVFTTSGRIVSISCAITPS